MKLSIKYSFNVFLVLGSLAMVGCGKSSNKVSTFSGSSPFTSGNGSLNSTVGSNIISQVQTLKNSTACSTGYRLTNDVSFYATSGSLSGSRLMVSSWQQGFLSNGTINKMWVGVSTFKDLMFVTQVVGANNQVVGFNVTLSFCEMKNAYPSLPSIVSNTRALDSFRTPYGIVLDADTYCGYNMVDAAINTLIVSRRDSTYGNYTSDAQIVTTFSKATCNGRY